MLKTNERWVYFTYTSFEPTVVHNITLNLKYSSRVQLKVLGSTENCRAEVQNLFCQ